MNWRIEKYLNFFKELNENRSFRCDGDYWRFGNEFNEHFVNHYLLPYHKSGKALLLLHDTLDPKHRIWESFIPIFGQYNDSRPNSFQHTKNVAFLDQSHPLFKNMHPFRLKLNDKYEFQVSEAHETIPYPNDQRIIIGYNKNLCYYRESERIGQIAISHSTRNKQGITQTENELLYNIICHLTRSE